MSKVRVSSSTSKSSKQHLVDHSNPFEPDSDGQINQKPRKASPAQAVRSSAFVSEKKMHKNEFHDLSFLESKSVQELETYAADKAKETTNQINGCLKIATEIREDASRTLVTLHQQGEQITRTHHTVANMDYDLSRGEKLLGNLGGIFSKTWKPKKTRQIKGPVVNFDNSFATKAYNIEQREKLGLSSSKATPNSRQLTSGLTPALMKVEEEKEKQDDALSDLSNLLGELKEMAVDMGSEIERQGKALDDLYEDADEINIRVKGANARGRNLLRK